MQKTKAKQTKTNNKGITLVALVITIIVLLILAAVGIGTISGPDGLIAKAKQAAEGYNDAAQDEAQTINELLNILQGGNQNLPESTTTSVSLKAQWPMMESENICPDSFKLKATAVDEEKGIASYKFYINGSLYKTETTTEETCIINVIGLEEETSYNCYVIVTNGAGEIRRSEEITVKTIANTATIEKINEYPKGYYGKNIEYKPINNATENWRIFYADEQNIYLITEDFIEHQYMPADTSGEVPNKRDNEFNVYFSDIVSYNDEGGRTAIVSEDENVKKWIQNLDEFTTAGSSLDALAYLLKTRIWVGFKDSSDENSFAEYAIGGPSLELFATSYRDTHENGIPLMYRRDDGYLTTLGLGAGGNPIREGGTLYTFSNPNTSSSMWLLSPGFGREYSFKYSTVGKCLVTIGGGGTFISQVVSGSQRVASNQIFYYERRTETSCVLESRIKIKV